MTCLTSSVRSSSSTEHHPWEPAARSTSEAPWLTATTPRSRSLARSVGTGSSRTGWPNTTARYTRGEGDDTTWVRSVPTNGTRPSMTGGTCLVGGWDDPILLQGHAAGLMLDRWFWFNEITGDKEDATYQRVVKLRQTYGPYRKG